MGGARKATLIVCAGALALTLTSAGCAEAPLPPEQQDTDVESMDTTVPPGEVPWEGQGPELGAGVGEPTIVGDWTVLISGVDMGPEAEGERPGNVTVMASLVHDADDPLPVRRDDWSLVDQAGEEYPPVRGNSMLDGEEEVPLDPGETAQITLYFEVPAPNGPFVLRFAPSEGGPGELRVAIP